MICAIHPGSSFSEGGADAGGEGVVGRGNLELGCLDDWVEGRITFGWVNLYSLYLP